MKIFQGGGSGVPNKRVGRQSQLGEMMDLLNHSTARKSASTDNWGTTFCRTV